MRYDKSDISDLCYFYLIENYILTVQESKALAARLEAEKKALADQLESGNKEVAERMQMEEERRKREADELKVKVNLISNYFITWLQNKSSSMLLFMFNTTLLFQTRMENAKQEQGNSITQMFDRLKVIDNQRYNYCVLMLCSLFMYKF